MGSSTRVSVTTRRVRGAKRYGTDSLARAEVDGTAAR